MVQGLYSAASGIRSNQMTMDVISNNIANVNTIAFKGSKAHFANVLLRTFSGGTKPSNALGGTNPLQLGNGSQLSEIAVNQMQGGTQYTGRSTDLLINGQGFFVVENSSSGAAVSNSVYLTRAGNFSLDAEGKMVTASGNRVLGTSMLSGKTAPTTDSVRVPVSLGIAKFKNATGELMGTSFGTTAATSGEFAANASARSITPTSTSIETVDLVNINIGASGAIMATYSNGDRLTVRPNPNSTTNSTEMIHLPAEGGTFSAINSTGSNGSMGQVAGANAAFTSGVAGIDPLKGATLQLQMVTVTNPNGLEATQRNGYLESANSGSTFFGVPGTGSRALIQSGSLENSNIDMANEFTSLVIAQRGLEANSRIIRAQSEVLQSIINSQG
jgi:flagellar hook protein FlgE